MKFTLMTIAAVAAISIPASASTIAGQLQINGGITATLTTISWIDNAATAQMANVGALGNTGSFTVLNPPPASEVGIANLNRNGVPPEPVGSLFTTPVAFITFPSQPTFPTLMLNFIPAGNGSSSQCSQTAAVGQTCTPVVPGGSPFTFINTDNGTGGISSSVTFNFSGFEAGSSVAWNGVFTSQFSTPFQTVLQNLGQPGFSVSTTYSATITAVPEPGSLAMMGCGLFLLAAGASRIRRRA